MASRWKESAIRKRSGLSKVSFGEKFSELPVQGLLHLAQWATEYRVGYMKTVATGLQLLSAELREEVTEWMSEQAVSSDHREEYGGTYYHTCLGGLKDNRLLHKKGGRGAAGARETSKWVRGGSGRIWELGNGQDVDIDNGLFPPGSSLAGAVQSHSHSFSLSDSFIINPY